MIPRTSPSSVSIPRRTVIKCRLALVPLTLLAGVLLPARADEPPVALLMQKPTLSKSHIVFAFAGDLGIVPRGQLAQLVID
jgi:hypothetical protein